MYLNNAQELKYPIESKFNLLIKYTPSSHKYGMSMLYINMQLSNASIIQYLFDK